jgi:hypothetical protein
MAFPPTFICGSPRSGTTLLVDMLGLHPELSPIYETEFVAAIAKLTIGEEAPPLSPEIEERIRSLMDRWTATLPHRPSSKRLHEKYHHGPHYILFGREPAMQATEVLLAELARGAPQGAALRRLVLELFAEHCRLDGKPEWINKNPSYIYQLPRLQAAFPDMRVISSVRDGRDTVCSLLSRKWAPSTVEGAADWWREAVRLGRAFGDEFPDRYREVRYEELISSPSEVLDRVFGWLGVSLDGKAIVDQHYGGEQVGLHRFPIGRWRTELSAADLAVLEDRAGDALKLMGYLEESPP